jgi:hypothetical protein
VRASPVGSAATEIRPLEVLLGAPAGLDDGERAEIGRALPALSHLLDRLEAPTLRGFSP